MKGSIWNGSWWTGGGGGGLKYGGVLNQTSKLITVVKTPRCQ